MTEVSYATATRTADVAYATREADAIHIGVDTAGTCASCRCPGVVVRHAREGDGTAFVYSGRRAADAEHSRFVAVHLLSEAVQRMRYELVAALYGMPVGHLVETASMFGKAFPRWARAAMDDPDRGYGPSGPSSR